MRKTTLAPGQLLRSVHMELPRQGGLPGAVQRVTHLSKLPRGNEKHVNSYRHQTMHRGKVDPGVSELSQGNELSRDHVNRPSVRLQIFIIIQANKW